MRSYRLRINTAYLQEDGSVVIYVNKWADGLKHFETNENKTGHYVATATWIIAVNTMRVDINNQDQQEEAMNKEKEECLNCGESFHKKDMAIVDNPREVYICKGCDNE